MYRDKIETDREQKDQQQQRGASYTSRPQANSVAGRDKLLHIAAVARAHILNLFHLVVGPLALADVHPGVLWALSALLEAATILRRLLNVHSHDRPGRHCVRGRASPFWL